MQARPMQGVCCLAVVNARLQVLHLFQYEHVCVKMPGSIKGYRPRAQPNYHRCRCPADLGATDRPSQQREAQLLQRQRLGSLWQTVITEFCTTFAETGRIVGVCA